MVLAASGSKSAAGASMRSAAQSNTKAATSNPRGPTGLSNSQPRSSPAGGGSPGAVSRGNYGTNSSSWSGGGGGSNNRSAASPRSGVQGSVSPTSGNSRGSNPVSTTPNAAAAKASQALNAGLGRPATSPVSRGVLNIRSDMGVGGAALGSFMTATEPAVRNYLSSPQNIEDQKAGWSALSQRTKANVMAREALNRPGMVSYPTTPEAPSGQFGPRTNVGSKYLSNAMQMGMITTGMPSQLSGMPQASQGQYSGYGMFSPQKQPPVLSASMGNTTSILKNSTDTPLVKLPDGTFTPSSRYSEVYQTPETVVPSWQQSTYAGMKPVQTPFTVGGAPYYGPNTPREAMGRMGQNPDFTAERGRQILDRVSMNIYNRGLANAPQTTTPSWQQSMYTGPQERILSVENVPDNTPVLRDEPQNFPVKPYGTKTKTLINAPLGLLPIVGDINTGLGLAGYSVGDYIVNEENKLANMTPEQRDRYRAYWAEKRANAPGRGPENRGSRDLAMRSDPPPVQSKEPTQTSRPSKPASSTWEADAKAYGYTDAQLKDPETRDLIKQLWEMGFIPKSNPST